MSNDIYLYLAVNLFGNWELFPNGKPSGKIVNRKQIKKLLNKQQWQEFKAGREFFYVDKKKLEPYLKFDENGRRTVDFDKFKS